MSNTTTPTIEPLAVGYDQLAELLSVSRATLERWDSAGRLGPRGQKIGGRRLFNMAEVRRWVEAGMPDRATWTAMQPTNGHGMGAALLRR